MATALLFPGQGAQAVGMGLELLARSSMAEDLFEEAAAVLGYDLRKICLEGPESELSRTEFSQPALFVHSYAALKQLEQDRPELWEDVRCLAGLSLGEYTAVAAAGGFSFADGVRLVQVRGLAMQAAADASPNGMSSVIGLEQEQIEKICEDATGQGELVRPANFLCPGNIAISGHLPALERAESLCAQAGAMKTIRLQVAGAFHTSIMQPAVQRLQAALQQMPLSPLRLPVVSNVDAASHVDIEDFQRLLPQQVVSPVLWESSVRKMLGDGIERFIEIGSGRVLAGTLKRINRKMPCENIGD